MPVVIVAAAIAAAAALIGAAIASGDEAKARAIREDIAKKIGDTKLPVLDRLVAQKLGPEELQKYQKITKPMQAQSDVLDKWMAEVNAKGETPEDRAAYLRMQQEADSISSAASSAVQRGMNARGLSGSGMEFALQQQGNQSAINRANASGIEAAADARGRYMDALRQAGALGGQMRGQELTAMGAQDEINKFNARAQSEADRYNASIAQQEFDNEMAKNAAESNAKNGVANDYDRAGANTRGTAGGVGNAAATLSQWELEQKKKKKGSDYEDSAGAS
jgi:hypothetical protein